ncbi:DUF2750 domain-containing protein [Pseudomonas sp. CVAP|uniref:DUF2750 domain-containing protein n=1 Tax=Pseudomonas sp. CVAP\|nr:DUF2750 domain-containing protein [Pseudomonas sp. CVAP\
MGTHQKKIENVLRLAPQERYDYFIRKVADVEVVWALFDNGWATAESGKITAVPFWPEEGFATLCASAEWNGFTAKPIELNDFLMRWLPGMQGDGRICQIFSTPDEQGLLVPPEDLLGVIKQELEQYE